MSGSIRYGVHGGVCVLKLEGELVCSSPDSVALSRALEQFLDHMVSTHATERYVIDMTETQHVDSTNLGILARIARTAAEEGREKPHIITTRPGVTRTLETMGFRHLFTLIDHDENVPEPEEALPGVPDSEQALARTVLRAHKELAAMNAQNQAAFQPVIDVLSQELDEGAP